MPREKNDRSAAIAAVQKGAEAVRYSAAELCRNAGVNEATYWRAVKTGRISLASLGKFEGAIAKAKAESAPI